MGEDRRVDGFFPRPPLARLVCPETIPIRPRAMPAAFATSAISAALAFPDSGAARTLAFSQAKPSASA